MITRFRSPLLVSLDRVSRHTLAALLCAAAAMMPVTAHAQIGINTALTPTPSTFGLTGIAWQLTPTTTTTVAGIRTWFSNAGGADRAVTFQIRGADVNGAALRSVTFNSSVARNGLGGADFTAFELLAGQSYWLTFEDILGLGRNVLEMAPATATFLPVRIRPPGSAGFVPAPIASSAPILELTAVPEPATIVLLVTGLAALSVIARRRGALRAGGAAG